MPTWVAFLSGEGWAYGPERTTHRDHEPGVMSQPALVRRAVENGPVTNTQHPSARYDDRAQR